MDMGATHELPDHIDLIRLMSERGVEDPEAKERFLEWRVALEEVVESSTEPRLKIWLNIWCARVYFQAGWFDQAFENYEDSLWQAVNEGEGELGEQISTEIENLKGKAA